MGRYGDIEWDDDKDRGVPHYLCGAQAVRNDVATKKQTKDELKKALDAVDWAKLDAMTDEQIEAAARSDRDNAPLTEDKLARFRRPVARSRRKPTAAE